MSHKQYHLKNIHDLLVEGFSEQELRRLCRYNPDFRPKPGGCISMNLIDSQKQLIKWLVRKRQAGKLEEEFYVF